MCGRYRGLNDSATADFYLVKIEGIRIAASPAAQLLTLIVPPSAEGRQAGENQEGAGGDPSIRRRFWTELLDRARQRTGLHTAISPTDVSWLGTSAGRSGLAGKDDIEKVSGEPLDWQPLEGRKACRIRWHTDEAGYRDEEQWPTLEETLIDAMVRLERALRPDINSLRI